MGKVFRMETQVSKDLWDNQAAREFAWRAVRDQCEELGKAEGYRPAEMGRDFDNAPLGQPFEVRWTSFHRFEWDWGPKLADCTDDVAQVVQLAMELYCVRGEINPAVNP